MRGGIATLANGLRWVRKVGQCSITGSPDDLQGWPTAAAFFCCPKLSRKACMALVPSDMLSNLLMSDSLRTSIPIWHNEPQRREEHPRELVVGQFNAVLLEFVHESLVCVLNHRALHLHFGAPKKIAHHARVLFPQAACCHQDGGSSVQRGRHRTSRRLRRILVVMNSKYAVW